MCTFSSRDGSTELFCVADLRSQYRINKKENTFIRILLVMADQNNYCERPLDASETINMARLMKISCQCEKINFDRILILACSLYIALCVAVCFEESHVPPFYFFVITKLCLGMLLFIVFG